MSRLFALRGATQLQVDTPEEMVKRVSELLNSLFAMNSIVPESVVSIQFTVTPDLTAMNPATAYRKGTGEGRIPLFCMQEPLVTGMLERTVRVMLHLYREETDAPLRSVYQGGTALLRPDLSGDVTS